MIDSKESLGSFWDNWEDELQKDKEDIMRAKTQKKIEAMQGRYNFTITEAILPALQRLEELVVNRVRSNDYHTEDSFYKVWWSVLLEVDLYEEQEESNSLNANAYKGAKNWLKSFSFLCEEQVPEEYRPKEG